MKTMKHICLVLALVLALSMGAAFAEADAPSPDLSGNIVVIEDATSTSSGRSTPVDKVVPGIVLGPRSGTGAGVNGQGGFLPAVAGDQPDHYQRHNGNQHARGQCKTQVGLLLLFGLWAAALRGLGLGLFAVGLAGLLFRLAGLPRRLFVLFHRRFPL